jgi:iron-sulfur cluster insertion protein|tara:strand:- start:149 stop:466 length:318 start_codon:yes stop_codon:yes gene_type:complete
MINEINFSENALSRINQLLSKKPTGTFFRIAVKGGGCSGFKYDFSFDQKIEKDDLKHKNIVIDKSSLDMLKGSMIEFSQELIGDSFKISNPKTKSSCGCGVSFSF